MGSAVEVKERTGKSKTVMPWSSGRTRGIAGQDGTFPAANIRKKGLCL